MGVWGGIAVGGLSSGLGFTVVRYGRRAHKGVLRWGFFKEEEIRV